METIMKLSPELQKYVEEQVRAGRFASVTEVVEAGLARLMLDPPPVEIDEETLAEIAASDEEYERGEYRDFKDVAAEIRAKYCPPRKQP